MQKQTVKVIQLREILTSQVNGNLALKNSEEHVYSAPKVKRLTFEKPKTQIVMGCWTSSYSSNDGDGC